MESTDTSNTPTPPKLRKDQLPLPEADYQEVKGRYPKLDWNDEDQSYTSKQGKKSYARKLYYFKPLDYDTIAMGRAKLAEQKKTQWDKFLGCLKNGMRVSKAAAAAGLTVPTVKARYRSDPEFRERWIEAEEIAAEPVEDALFDAATNGNVPAATRWLEDRAPERWPKPKQETKTVNVFEIDVTDRMGNIQKLLAQLEKRAELDAGPQIVDVDSSEPGE